MLTGIIERLGRASVDSYLELCGAALKSRRQIPRSGMFLNWADDARAAEEARRVNNERERKRNDKQDREARIIGLGGALVWVRDKERGADDLPDSWVEHAKKLIAEAELAEAKERLKSGVQ